MSLVRCNACRGEYDTELLDGSRYFHVCPPLNPAEARELLDAGRLELPANQRQKLDDARAADAREPRTAPAASRVDELLYALAIPRPGARNENIHGASGRGKPQDPLFEGAGATKIGEMRGRDREV